MKLLVFLQKNKKNLPDCKDLLMLIGIFMAGKGIYMIYKPAMWVLCGIFLIYLGWPRRQVVT